MGEISEMMLTGVMCAMCGEFLDCKQCQDMEIPMYCSDQCFKDAGEEKNFGWDARICSRVHKD